MAKLCVLALLIVAYVTELSVIQSISLAVLTAIIYFLYYYEAYFDSLGRRGLMFPILQHISAFVLGCVLSFFGVGVITNTMAFFAFILPILMLGVFEAAHQGRTYAARNQATESI